MAVIYAPKQNNSGLGSVVGPLSLVSAFVPGLQPVAAGLSAVNSASKGDVAGTAKNAATLLGGVSGISNAANTISNASNQTQNAAQVSDAVAQYNQQARPYSRSLGALNLYNTLFGRN